MCICPRNLAICMMNANDERLEIIEILRNCVTQLYTKFHKNLTKIVTKVSSPPCFTFVIPSIHLPTWLSIHRFPFRKQAARGWTGVINRPKRYSTMKGRMALAAGKNSAGSVFGHVIGVHSNKKTTKSLSGERRPSGEKGGSLNIDTQARERERMALGRGLNQAGGWSTMMAVGSARSVETRAASSWPAEFCSVNIANAEPNWRALCHSTEQKLIG